jgi:opacity protein-like surface antigen
MRRWSLLLAFVLAVLVLPSTASAEWFAGFYLGGAVTTSENIKFDLFGNQVTQELDTGGSVSVGARGGYWIEQFPWLGHAVDVGYISPATDIITFPFTALLMARYPLMKDDEFRDGRLQPYVGIGGGPFVTKVDGGLGTVPVNDTSVDLGFDMRVGAAYFIEPNISAFAEYRFTHVSTSFDVNIFGSTVKKLEPSFSTHHFLVGLGFRF